MFDDNVSTPTLRAVRDSYSGAGVEADLDVIRTRREQFDRFIESIRQEANQVVVDRVEMALYGVLRSDPAPVFPVAIYLDEAMAVGGRSKWALRYVEEARLSLPERRDNDNLHHAVYLAIQPAG